MSAHVSRELIDLIISDPESDSLRLDFADQSEKSDKQLSQFIRLQISRARQKRISQSSEFLRPGREERQLLREFESRWIGDIRKYAEQWYFYRGFIVEAIVEPIRFLETNAAILNNFPIQHLGFTLPRMGDFPLEEIFNHPAIRHLDSIGVSGQHISKSHIKKIASSENLNSCLWLGLSRISLDIDDFRLLASSPHIKKVLYIDRRSGDGSDYFPGQRLQPVPIEQEDPWRSNPWEWAPLGEDGVALEREFGYIPWLHPQDNACDKFDARWFVNQGILPKRPFGSPVEP